MGDEINADPLKVLDGTERVALCHCDVLQLLARLPDNSVDSMVTDPPYGLSAHSTKDVIEALTCWLSGKPFLIKKKGFMQSSWDAFVPGPEVWREVFRILKPGAHLLVFAGTRTEDLMGIAIRLAGFQRRETLEWLYGSGMPKSLNISKQIDARNGTNHLRQVVHTYTAGGNAGTSCKDKGGTYSVGAENSEAIELTVTSGGCDEAKRWDGWGSGLKPAHEPILVFRKPLVGTLAENVLAHGCGGLNIDSCRVPTDWTERPPSWHASGHSAKPEADKIAAPPGVGIQCHPGGRHPANLLLSHADCGDRCVSGCPVLVVTEQSGQLKNGGQNATSDRHSESVAHGEWAQPPPTMFAGDSGSCARFFNQFRPHPLDSVPPFIYEKKPSRREKELGCEHLPKRTRGETTKRKDGSAALDCPRTGAGRSGGARNVHPTTKGVALMRYLCRLVTPPGGVCLDGFMGSGTTAVACVLEGFRFIGCDWLDTEAEPYVTIARARVAHATTWTEPDPQSGEQAPKQGNLFAGRG